MKKYILALTLSAMFIGCGKSNIVKSNDFNESKTSSFIVSIKDSKINHSVKNYSVSENIVLNVTVVNSANITSYTWKEGDIVLGSSSKLDRKFPVGSHTVTVEVVADNHTESATFNFEVTDKSNFVTKKLGIREDEVLVDTTYNLMWVSDKDESKEACLAVHESNLTLAENLSREFCKNIDFGEFEVGSWRAPTPDELSNFIIQTVNQDILPAYYKECNLLFSDENGTGKVVATRYGIANEIEIKVTPDGQTYPNAKLGEALEFRTHYGIRCVRDIK